MTLDICASGAASLRAAARRRENRQSAWAARRCSLPRALDCAVQVRSVSAWSARAGSRGCLLPARSQTSSNRGQPPPRGSGLDQAALKASRSVEERGWRAHTPRRHPPSFLLRFSAEAQPKMPDEEPGATHTQRGAGVRQAGRRHGGRTRAIDARSGTYRRGCC